MDVMIDHWERERPDLDASSLAIIYRNPFLERFRYRDRAFIEAAEALGRLIAADEQQAVEPEAHRVKPTLYLGVDGTGIPVRKAETAQRQGKQPDGSAKTREVKLAVAWTAERRHPKTGIPMRDPDSVS